MSQPNMITTPRLCYISLTRIFPYWFGLPFLLSSGGPMSIYLQFVSRCVPISFTSHGRTTSVVFYNFIGRLHSCCPSNVFISDRIPPCHSAHPSKHSSSSHLLLYSRASCPLVHGCHAGLNRAGLTTVL